MATATASPSTDSADDLRRQMAQIRQRLHQDMQGVVAGAEAASDWKHYVRLYPLAALGAAFAAGFVIVPRKRRSATRTAEKTAEAVVAKFASAAENGAMQATAVEPSKERARKGIIGAALALAGPLVLRAAQSYALSYVENWIAQQQAASEPSPQQPMTGTKPGPSVGR